MCTYISLGLITTNSCFNICLLKAFPKQDFPPVWTCVCLNTRLLFFCNWNSIVSLLTQCQILTLSFAFRDAFSITGVLQWNRNKCSCHISLCNAVNSHCEQQNIRWKKAGRKAKMVLALYVSLPHRWSLESVLAIIGVLALLPPPPPSSGQRSMTLFRSVVFACLLHVSFLLSFQWNLFPEPFPSHNRGC